MAHQHHHLPVNTPSVSKQRFENSASRLTELVKFLRYGEYELIVFMEKNGFWQGNKPHIPAGYKPGTGTIDYGIYLYWANNPSAVKALTNEDLDWVILAFVVMLKACGVALPPSLITPANYQLLKGNRMIYSDGSVISTEPFGTFDPNWLRTLINLGITSVFGANYKDNVFPSPSEGPFPVVLSGAQPSSVCVGLVGDWGAGTAVAATVMNSLTALAPDYLIHLGDIYYSGSPASDKDLSFSYDHLGEVQTNFLDYCPTDAYAGKSFTMNGNHEMYSGGNGLFQDALTHPAFSSQGGLTYGALQVGDWTILYLDSAYCAQAEQLYMYGSIGGPADVQSVWISSLKVNPAKVIILTHHNAFDPICSVDPQPEYYQPFWDAVKGALGGDPYAWYWGHVHNAIVYQAPVQIGSFTTNTLCRCIGHGSMPYGATDALKQSVGNAGPFTWCAQYTVDSADLPNGFTTLTFELDAQNKVNAIWEKYYLTNDLTKPAFNSALFREVS